MTYLISVIQNKMFLFTIFEEKNIQFPLTIFELGANIHFLGDFIFNNKNYSGTNIEVKIRICEYHFSNDAYLRSRKKEIDQ